MLVLVVTTHLYKTNKRKEREERSKRKKKWRRNSFSSETPVLGIFVGKHFFLIFSSGEKKLWRAAKASQNCRYSRGCVTQYLTLVINHSYIGTHRGISLKIAEAAKNSLQKPIEEKWWNFDRKIGQGNHPMKFLRQHNSVLIAISTQRLTCLKMS